MLTLKILLLFSCLTIFDGPGRYIVRLHFIWQSSSLNDATHILDDEMECNDPISGTFDIAYPNGTKLIQVGVHMAKGNDPCFDIRSTYIGGTPFLTENGVGSGDTWEAIEMFSDVLWICAWGGSADLYGGTESWIGDTLIHNGAYYNWMDYVYYWQGFYTPLPI